MMSSLNSNVFEEEFLFQIDVLYIFVYYLIYNEEDVNDFVQEIYFKVYCFIDSYNVGINVKVWLFCIFKNVFINQYWKKSKQFIQVDYEEIINYYDEEDLSLMFYYDFREEMFQGMMGDEVINVINVLLVDFCVVILFCDVEGFMYEEIFKIVDIFIGMVCFCLYWARNMLKE